jgi:hypothetical protein
VRAAGVTMRSHQLCCADKSSVSITIISINNQTDVVQFFPSRRRVEVSGLGFEVWGLEFSGGHAALLPRSPEHESCNSADCYRATFLLQTSKMILFQLFLSLHYAFLKSLRRVHLLMIDTSVSIDNPAV